MASHQRSEPEVVNNELNPLELLLAKRNCNLCYGRGYNTVERGISSATPIVYGMPYIRYGELCTCVKNKIQKNDK